MSKKTLTVNEGDIYFIPLFLSHDMSNKSYFRYKFEEDRQNFCFLRIIKDLKGSGILIEVFKYIGNLKSPIESIISSGRLFEPVLIIGDGIHKKRWRKIGETLNYNCELHSNFNQIKLIIGGLDNPRIWQNHKTKDPNEDISLIEEGIMWVACQLESRIVKLLSNK
ncbi:hypothetical protein CPU12_04985 [Malaciobacter molluscorum LMG 25693]|uniref:Uncharacterized protein n=1 Tax=Malaciobacter molluscorum LMG 25693 TaxID=870501 RepID=A0A2G1DJF9_9BACT|nr:Imm26 family immunity protein [Malaciobacter molluscorum]AXX91566.1 hypothetical protein AMOL_0564 [Malaciobacter molluscorum LMG 25693]PHO18637.1 hypothetical protein CPU12_04985 [Malaciobacter molluscorum LMG 25693]